MSEPSKDVILIENVHVPACGALPDWAKIRPKGSYFSYFEGQSGDQWVFLATPDSVKLAGGDSEWDNTYEIKPTKALMEKWKICEDLVWPENLLLDKAERLWLTACMMGCANTILYRLSLDRPR